MRSLLFLALLAPLATAHDGPPYPILVDEPVAGWSVSVWADPDVGTGTYYVYLEGAGELPELEVRSVPVDGHGPPAVVRGRTADEGRPYQLIALVPHDARGTWTTSFRLGDAERVLTVDVEVTPPGLGPFDIVLYLSPFLLVAFLWARGLARQRAWSEEQERGAGGGEAPPQRPPPSPSSGPDSL